jgi:hypothetical protein
MTESASGTRPTRPLPNYEGPGRAVLGIAWRLEMPEPLLIAAGAAVGLVIVSLR